MTRARDESSDGALSAPAAIRRVRLTAAQEALWLAEQMTPGTSLRHICAAWRLTGSVDVAALRQALAEVVRRHPVMSACIDVEDGTAFQVVRQDASVPLEVVDCAGKGDEASGDDDAVRESVMGIVHRRFDLAAGPLTRVALVRCSPMQSILCVAAHHIVWDGSSTDVFARELASCYASTLDGSLSRVDRIPATFLDLAAAAGGAPEAGSTADLTWWKDKLTPLPPALCLVERHAVGARIPRGATVSRVLRHEVAIGMRALSRAEHATPFMTMLAALAALLFRLTGQEDMTIAVPVSGRTEPGSERMIGLFVRTLPIRLSVRADESFVELLRHVREAVLAALAHQALAYPVLVRQMSLDRHETADPLCQVAFQLRRRLQDALVLPGIVVERYDVGAPSSAYDLTMTVDDDGDSLTTSTSFDPAALDPDSVRRLLGRYELLLEAALDAQASQVGDLNLLDKEEEQMLIDSWGGRAKEGCVPATTVHSLVESWSRAHPDAVAVEEGADVLTYGELDARAGRLARLLRLRGVSRHSVVGLLMGRSTATVTAMLAVLKAGGAYLPLDPDYPVARLSSMTRLARPALVLAASRPHGDVASGVAMLDVQGALAEASSLSCESAGVDTGPEDPAYVMFTSGSTGEPKGVVIPHRGIVQLVSDRGYWDGDQRDHVAHLSTVAFDAATFEIWGALCRGARLVIVDRDTLLSPVLLGQEFERHHVTTAFLTTSLFNMLAREAPALLERLRLVLFGGEMADPAAVRLLLASGPPARLLHVYGPTETTTFALWHEVHDVPETAVTVPVGRPIRGATAYVVDAAGRLTPPGAKGELCIGGAGVALGYLGDETATTAKFVPDLWASTPGHRVYKTGDWAVWRDDGNLELKGRLDDQVKIRGFRIEPAEIVAALERLDGVRQAVVVVREDRPGDRRLVSYVVSVDGQPLDTRAIAGSLADLLPPFMLPSAYVQVSTLPMTPNGKLDIRSLPAPTSPASVAGRSDTPNEAERQLAEVWKRVLGLTAIGVDDNFFDLGGHSLAAVRLVADIERLMGIRIPMSTLFQTPTVRSLGELLSREGWTPEWKCLVPVRATGSLPPVFCVHGYGGEILWSSGISRELGPDQPFYGLQPQGLDGRTEPLHSVQDMAARYVAEIRNVAPRGPYYLLGYSLGGAVAFEMARQLEARGQRVAFLGLIDSGFPRAADATRIPLLVRLRLHAKEISRRTPTDAIRYVGRRINALRQRIALAADSRDSRERRVASAGEAAWRSYTPEPWAGRLTLFASTGPEDTIWEDSRPRWSTVVGGMDVVAVRGTHASIVGGTDVVRLAAAIRTGLASARELWERPADVE